MLKWHHYLRSDFRKVQRKAFEKMFSIELLITMFVDDTWCGLQPKQKIELTGARGQHVDIMMLSMGGWYVGKQSPQLNPWCYKTWGKVDKTFGCTVKYYTNDLNMKSFWILHGVVNEHNTACHPKRGTRSEFITLMYWGDTLSLCISSQLWCCRKYWIASHYYSIEIKPVSICIVFHQKFQFGF